MSDWHDEFTEPMHDTPADKDPLIAAMEAAGYTYDGLESTNDNLRFFGEGGQVITMGGWHECEEWLNGVVFDDPQVMNRVEIILHPERFPERDPGRAALRAVEDAVEQNDNSFDGIINSKTRATYEEYRKAGYSKKFLEAHREEITIHKAAKTAFDELGVKKLPRVKDLSIEYAEVLAAKKQTYAEYRLAKNNAQELLIAQQNIASLYDAERKEEDQKRRKDEQSH